MINRGSRLLMSLVIIALLVGAWVAVPRGVVSRTLAAAPIADLDEISRLVQYVNSHVTGLSKNEASQLILQLEEAQRRYLPSLESRYYAQEDLGAVFFESYVAGVDPNHMDLIAEGELKELLWATHAGGFKVETAEGTFYPVIDYSRYEKYTLLVTDDIAEYIRIMAREITQPAAKDAALLIGWDEILSRALQQERFITKYPHSPLGSRRSRSFMLAMSTWCCTVPIILRFLPMLQAPGTIGLVWLQQLSWSTPEWARFIPAVNLPGAWESGWKG